VSCGADPWSAVDPLVGLRAAFFVAPASGLRAAFFVARASGLRAAFLCGAGVRPVSGFVDSSEAHSYGNGCVNDSDTGKCLLLSVSKVRRCAIVTAAIVTSGSDNVRRCSKSASRNSYHTVINAFSRDLVPSAT